MGDRRKEDPNSSMTRTYCRGITVPKDDAEGSSKCGWEAPSPHWTRFAHYGTVGLAGVILRRISLWRTPAAL